MIAADDGAVGGNADDAHAVDGAELGFFRLGRTGHAGELVVEAEEVLIGDRRDGLELALDADSLFRLDGFVEAVGIAAAGLEVAGVLVDDDDLALFDDVVVLALEEGVGFDGGVEVMDDVDVLGVGEVLDAQDLLDLDGAGLGEGCLVRLLVEEVVAVVLLGLRAGGDLQAADDAVNLDEEMGRSQRRAGDDQRRPGRGWTCCRGDSRSRVPSSGRR